ncbi:MAG: hypothetical protein LC670_03070, partial [Flavobacteriales bacterium]|nr:hypothetical protein [Flavobacteriales bacterium]
MSKPTPLKVPLKRITATLLTLVLIAAIAAAAAYFLAKKYEPEVRDIVVYEVNRLLDVEVSVEDINFSLLQRFPYASLRFSEVVIPEVYSTGTPDTLLYAKNVYLQISLWDFLRKRYRISEAEVNDGFFRMAIFKDGKDNYHFWKASESADRSVLSLNNIETNNFDFSLRMEDKADLDVHVRHARSKGSFGSDVYDLASEVHLTVGLFALSGDTLYREIPISGKFNLGVNNLSNKYEITSDALESGNEKFKIDGWFDPEHSDTWGVTMRASGAKIENAVGLLPLGIRSKFAAYNAKGRSDLVLDMEQPAGEPFKIDFLFDKTKGSFQHDVALGKAGIESAAGSLQIRGERISLYIDHIHGAIGPGKIKMSGSIRDFDAPDFDLAVNGNVELREVRNFFNIDYLDEMSGKVSLA